MTAAPQTKTEDVQTLILDNSARVDLGIDIRSVQVHLRGQNFVHLISISIYIYHVYIELRISNWGMGGQNQIYTIHHEYHDVNIFKPIAKICLGSNFLSKQSYAHTRTFAHRKTHTHRNYHSICLSLSRCIFQNDLCLLVVSEYHSICGGMSGDSHSWHE